jgi:RNA polymerase sigma factor (sigma-70 family)
LFIQNIIVALPVLKTSYRMDLRKIQSSDAIYNSNEELLISDLLLKRSEAIVYLFQRLIKFQEARRNSQLSKQEVDDVAIDTVCVCIQNLVDNKYSKNGNKFTTYAIEIFKRLLIKSIANKKRNDLVLVELPAAFVEDLKFEMDSYTLEYKLNLLVEALSKLPPKYAQLINIKYFKKISDHDAIQSGTLSYKNTDTVKNLRSRALKYLATIYSELEDKSEL